ncbi:FixH family protein [Paenibacillus sp. N3.4]|uniref:FixH family protein n=1 Tax=Paenibacillus sp. N3.4 TaxID=2603222 RepID=UPI0011C89674|nr:FixH family protein [Paenibacillus sp. N3.4]TXK85007.1 hypothetical protein FU659_05755 [Paenibacillus sp. N3.4]
MKIAYWLVLMGIILTGCKDSSMDDMDISGMNQSSMKLIQVDVKISPDHPKPDEAVEVQATVTLDGEKVKKLNELTFEIWEEGQSGNHEKIKGRKKENGVYTMKTTFQKAGTYNITSHTTAAGMHAMPTQQFEVAAK